MKALSLLASLTLLTSTATAEEVFSNFGPNGEYSARPAYIMTDNVLGTMDVACRLRPERAGLPGAILATTIQTVTVENLPGVVLDPPTRFEFSDPILLDPGSLYWLSADAITNQTHFGVFWAHNVTSDPGLTAVQLGTSPVWMPESNPPAAYRVISRDGMGLAGCLPTVPNSTGVAGELIAPGSAVATDNDLALLVRDLPVGEFGIFLNSQTLGAGTTPTGSFGTRSLGGAIGRYSSAIFLTSAGGVASLELDLGQTPTPTGLVAIVAGQTWHFQAWHRDAAAGGSNLTNSVGVAFL